jgi:hypothetical protein
MATLVVAAAGREYRLTPGESLTFGRASRCMIRLDPGDSGISRVAGEIEFVAQVWFVSNRSRSRQLSVIDQLGLRRVLAPGQRDPVEGRTRVLVDGSRGSHELVLEGPEPTVEPAQVATGLPTVAGEDVIKPAERLALIALFAGYLLEGDRYDPVPRSYAAAAKRLGYEPKTLSKRIENLRTRLTKAGVPNLHGPNALAALAEYALTTGTITAKDLRLIGL